MVGVIGNGFVYFCEVVKNWEEFLGGIFGILWERDFWDVVFCFVGSWVVCNEIFRIIVEFV